MKISIIVLFAFSRLSFSANCQTAFACDGFAYQTVGSPSHLYRFDFINNIYTDLGQIGPGIELRATGYNTADNFAYGIQNTTKNLIKIGANRATTSTVLTGTYANDFVGVNAVAADFGPGGFLYVMLGGSTNTVYIVNVSTATVNDRFFTSAAFDKGDIVWCSPDSKFYCVGSPGIISRPNKLL